MPKKKRVSSGKNWRYGKWWMQCTQKHRFTHWFFPLLLQSLGVHPISRQNHPIYIDIDIDSRFVLVLHSTSQLYRVCVALPAAPRTQYQALSRQEAGDVTLLFFGVSETQPIASSRIEMVVCQPLCYFRTKPCCSAPPSSKAHVRMQQVSRSANDRCGGAAFAGLSSTVSRAVNEISVRVVPSRLLYSAVNCIIAFYTISGQTMGKHLIFQY